VAPSNDSDGYKQRIAHFEVIERLGAGGMGVVYRASDTVLEREVALKLIRTQVAGEEELRHRFLREARLAASINHPGVAMLYEAGEADPDGEGQPQLFLASELVEGRSLEEILADGPLPVDRVVDLGIQLAEALAAAHQLGIVHRDVKPSNLMVKSDGCLKVLDFGIAKRIGWVGEEADSAATLTYTARGAVVGTPAYMAPEQVAGGTADGRTDIHGAGCVLYQMLTGKPPFGAGSPSEVMRRVIVTPPEPLRSIRTDVPRAIAEVVERALAKEPDDRFQTADELAEALGEATDSTGVRDALRGFGRGVPRILGMAAALVLLIAISMFAGRKLFGNAIAFEERDWLLVADVVNETGDEGFTLALKSALETDLRQSRHVNVFDGIQVRNTLKMMRREETAEIDLDTGLEMCRFAGVRALLVPRINAVGDVYILQASLVDPANGRVADRIRITAEGREEVLLETIDALTRRVRRGLGESLGSISESDPPLTQYTTSSWEALRLVALGSREWSASRFTDAARNFELALEEDPDFAMARGGLGLLYIQFLGRPEDGKQLLAEALEGASEVSRREYLLLRAIHRQFVDHDLEEALADYRMISDFYPDIMAPYNNSGRILQYLGRYEDAVRMYERARHVDPRSSIPVHNVWWVLLQNLLRPVAAEEAARTMARLEPESAWARHSVGWTLVALRRFDEAEAEIRTVLEIDPTHRYGRANLAHLLYRRGSFDEAVEIYRGIHLESHESQQIQSDAFDGLCLGLALQGAGRGDEARGVLEAELGVLLTRSSASQDESAGPTREASLLAALGREREAREKAVVLEGEAAGDPQAQFILAEVFTMIGDPDLAMAALERAVEIGYDDPYYILINPPLRGLQDRPELDELAPYE
jgi:tetratricopeptide (TPR) repeat protein/tRNA A-37 threonylcarbamoyl transferase component Bud32